MGWRSVNGGRNVAGGAVAREPARVNLVTMVYSVHVPFLETILKDSNLWGHVGLVRRSDTLGGVRPSA